MGGERLREYWTVEMSAVLEAYRQFETLIPAKSGGGSAHPGEDGRYVESILKETLKKFLPSNIEVLNGFILRAGIHSGFSSKLRKKDEDIHSSQLDLIIYDSANYPVYQRFGDTAVVLPEGVLGIISVKKTLRKKDLTHEIAMLKKAGELCAFQGRKGPFLALVGMDDNIGKSNTCFSNVTNSIEKVFSDESIYYDEMPGFVGNLQRWTIHRVRKENSCCAEYQMYEHERKEEYIGLQFLLKGILDTYYSEGRGNGKQPGFVSFPSGKGFTERKDGMEYHAERRFM